MDKRDTAEVSRRGFLGLAALASASAVVGSACENKPAATLESAGPPCACGGASQSRPSGAGKPNIVYIFSDQHRGDALGASGNKVVQTPNLDELARRGVTFGRCYTNSPLCRPARASMMCGVLPREHGVWHNFAVPSQQAETHVRRLRDEAGYHTAVIGKTHLHEGEGDIDQYRCILENFGFEDVHELPDAGQAAKIKSSWSRYLQDTTPPGELDKWKRYRRLVTTYARLFKSAPWDQAAFDDPPFSLPPEDHLDLYTGRLAAKWLADVQPSRPFYLQLCLPGPHDPFDAPGEIRALYDPRDPRLLAGTDDRPEPPYSPLVGQAIAYQDVRHMTVEQRARLRALYYAKITLVDRAVGLVTQALEARGLLDNTWVVYGSDHGEMCGDHGLMNKTVPYEGSWRVPLVMRPPKGCEPLRCDGLVDQLDVTTTLLSIGGLGPGKAQGRSLEGIALYKEPCKGKDAVIGEVQGIGFVRTERHKLVLQYAAKRPLELYDLEADPGEAKNLVEEPAQARTIEALLARYFAAGAGAQQARFEDQGDTGV
ncbi:MAG: sulfatase-like hydrolase/transferase [Myxococcota bacterium]|jgi:choline-sulfatase|nr:sulfatase-like hydrolase/transferase [Myxococcota bacterium]